MFALLQLFYFSLVTMYKERIVFVHRCYVEFPEETSILKSSKAQNWLKLSVFMLPMLLSLYGTEARAITTWPILFKFLQNFVV